MKLKKKKSYFNVFEIFSMGLHFSLYECKTYRDKNIEFVKNKDLDSFTGKLRMFKNKTIKMEYLTEPENNKFLHVKYYYII